MFKKLCLIPQPAQRRTNKQSTYFIRSILEEERRNNELYLRELQSTAENPRIIERNEMMEISVELCEHKREQALLEKRRRQLQHNHPELRDLINQLQLAQNMRQFVDQRVKWEKEQKETDTTKEELHKYQEFLAKEAEAERQIELRERRQKDELRAILQNQMTEKLIRRKEECQEVKNDYEKMRVQLKRMQAEDISEHASLQQRKEKNARDIQEFLALQKYYKQQQQEIATKEDAVIGKELCDERSRALLEKRLDKLHQRQVMSNEIGQRLIKVESEKRHREDLLLDLLVEERKAKDDQSYRQKLEKQHEERANLRFEMERYRTTVDRDIFERKQNAHLAFKSKGILTMTEDELQAKMERQHQQKEAYKRTLLENIELNRLQRLKDTADNMLQHKQYLEDDLRRQQDIDNERLRLLKEQPIEVLRYLPHGILRDSERYLLTPSTAKSGGEEEAGEATHRG